jgi:hypothetical protein
MRGVKEAEENGVPAEKFRPSSLDGAHFCSFSLDRDLNHLLEMFRTHGGPTART